MSKNARCSMPGNSAVRAASAARCSRATAASWLACPKVNSRKKIPSVEGAYTSSNTRGVPPARNTSTSSMLSAPQIMPPMIVVSFPTGLTAPDFTRVDGRSTCLPINHERPVCSASSMIGTKPAADTRFGSSNIADPTVNACDDCTGNAFRTRDYFDFENRYCPSSGGIFAVHTPITNDRPSTDSGVVHVGGNVQAQPSMAMFVVVPAEEGLAVPTGGLDRVEPVGEIGPILQCLELRLAERVVVGHVRARVRLGDAEVGEQERHRLGGHRGAAVGVDGQLVAADTVLGTSLADQHLGQGRGFAGSDHPSDHVAGEDVQDHVQVVPAPLRGAAQLGDIPRPYGIRLVGNQFRFHGGRVGGLPAPFPALAALT